MMALTSKQLKNLRRRQARERSERLLARAQVMDLLAAQADDQNLLNNAIHYANLATTYREEAKKPPAPKIRTQETRCDR